MSERKIKTVALVAGICWLMLAWAFDRLFVSGTFLALVVAPPFWLSMRTWVREWFK